MQTKKFIVKWREVVTCIYIYNIDLSKGLIALWFYFLTYSSKTTFILTDHFLYILNFKMLIVLLDIPFTYMFPHVDNPKGFSTTPGQVLDNLAEQLYRLG